MRPFNETGINDNDNDNDIVYELNPQPAHITRDIESWLHYPLKPFVDRYPRPNKVTAKTRRKRRVKNKLAKKSRQHNRK